MQATIVAMMSDKLIPPLPREREDDSALRHRKQSKAVKATARNKGFNPTTSALIGVFSIVSSRSGAVDSIGGESTAPSAGGARR
jgi:hypothetical protein